MEYVYVFAFREQKLLLVLNRKRGWEAPGGKIEAGETPEEAAVREFMEETGRPLMILCYEFFGGGHVFYGIAGDKQVEIQDPVIEDTGFFDTFPENLAFPVGEYRELTGRGLECLKGVRGND